MRAPSTGTALASTPDSLVAARGAAADRDGLIVVGSVTALGSGSVGQRAAVWRAPTADGPWTRTDLPGDGALGEAHAASCDDVGRCTVVGEVDGALRGWSVPPDGAPTALALPALAVGEHDLLTAPLPGDDGPTVLLASGGTLVVLTLSGSHGTVDGDGSPVRRQIGPPATTVRSTARLPGVDGATYVVLEDAAGTVRLVRLTLR